MRRGLAAVAVISLVAAACGSSSPRAAGTSQPGSSSPAGPATGSGTTAGPGSAPDLGSVRLRLVRVAQLDQPLAMAIRSGDEALYVAEKGGRIVAIRGGSVDPAPVLDLSGEVSTGGEQGLLGLAFSPDGRFLYVSFTDTNGNSHVTEFAMSGDRVDVASRRDVLVVDQPYSNHNGGNLGFGPDGDLYFGLGDGGSEGDPDGRGQDLGTLLGKMLRIDPRPDDGRPYGVPGDNPFVERAGARPEIWAYGLRNPWRYSFDRLTGDLWIGDVGQNAWEEVDFQPASSSGGENYGWNRFEGSHPYQGSDPGNAVPPIFEYSHDTGGCVVTGGYVYRGRAIAGLQGAYVFADYCLGRVSALVQRDGHVVDQRTFSAEVPQLASFGEDADGELYALSLEGPVYRLAAG